jgi:hypothetical protein
VTSYSVVQGDGRAVVTTITINAVSPAQLAGDANQ